MYRHFMVCGRYVTLFYVISPNTVSHDLGHWVKVCAVALVSLSGVFKGSEIQLTRMGLVQKGKGFPVDVL